MAGHSATTRLLTAATFAALAFAQVAKATDCWLDLYDKPNFQGHRLHLIGPARLKSLKNLQSGDWSNRVESLIVGPRASVMVFRAEGCKCEPTSSDNPLNQNDIMFGGGEEINDLKEQGFQDAINSVSIRCLL
jgi:hypothetical protein